MIDRIRHDIQQRLDQLLTEADKLRRALSACPRRARCAQTENDKVAADREDPGRSEADFDAAADTHSRHGERREHVDANGAR